MSVTDVIERQERDEQERHAAIDAAVKGWSPRGDKIVLARMRPIEQKVGSLVIPGRASEHGDKVDRKGMLARVVAVGPDASVAVNEHVYCSSFAGSLVEIAGHSLLVISEMELLLVASSDAPDGGTQADGFRT